jgi:hypothetical protein
MKTTFVHLAIQIAGQHHWPGAHGTEVYLSHPHRHLFTVDLDVQVVHGDRELEIIAEARWLSEFAASLAERESDGLLDFGPQSCEHLSDRIVTAATDRFGAHRRIRCQVLEDDVLGAFTEYVPETRTPTS